MMHGPEKSDRAIVAGKPTNKAERSAAELVERRAGTKGNESQPSTCRAQCRISVTQGVGSHTAACCRQYPRWEPYAGKPHVRICAGGGREVTRVPTANGSPNGCIESKTEVLGTSVSSLLHLNEQTLAEL